MLYDLASSSFALSIILLAWIRVDVKDITTREIFCNVIGISHHICILALLISCRKFFAQWRLHILVPHMILTLYFFYCHSITQPQFVKVHPLQIPTLASKAVLFFLRMPAVLLWLSVCYILPVKVFKPFAIFQLIISQYGSFGRCGMEMAALPQQADKYRIIATAIEAIIFRWFPLISEQSSDQFGVVSLNDVATCTLVNSTLQITVSCFFPLALLPVSETISRHRFEQTTAILDNFALKHHYPSLLISNLLLIPLQVAATFRALVLLLSWATSLGWC